MDLFSSFSDQDIKDWIQKIESDLKGASLESLNRDYRNDLEIKAVLHQEAQSSIGSLSNFPSFWHLVQDLDLNHPEEFNRYALDALQTGASGLLVRVNKPLSTKEWEAAFKNISTQDIALYFDGIGMSDLDTLRNAVEFCKGNDENRIPPTLLFDPINQALINGGWIRSESDDLAPWSFLVQDSDWKLCINLEGISQAGAGLSTQLALALSRTQDLVKRFGDSILSRIHIHMNQGLAFFPEISKVRALHKLWEFFTQAYSNTSPLSCTASANIRYESVFDAHNNLLRQTTQAMSGILGGVHGFMATRFDRSYASSTGFSLRMGRNLQLLLRDESFLGKQKDLGAGAYLIEDLCLQLEEKSFKLFKEWEKEGGFMKIVDSGILQTQIEKEARSEKSDFESGDIKMVGVNIFENKEEDPSDKIEFEITLLAEADGQDFRPIRPERLAQSAELKRLEELENQEG